MRAAVLALALTATSCAAAQKTVDIAQKAVETAKAGVYLAHVADRYLVEAYERELNDCLPKDDPSGVEVIDANVLGCVEHVRQEWLPLKDAYVDLRKKFCELDKAIDGHSCPEEAPK